MQCQKLLVKRQAANVKLQKFQRAKQTEVPYATTTTQAADPRNWEDSACADNMVSHQEQALALIDASCTHTPDLDARTVVLLQNLDSCVNLLLRHWTILSDKFVTLPLLEKASGRDGPVPDLESHGINFHMMGLLQSLH